MALNNSGVRQLKKVQLLQQAGWIFFDDTKNVDSSYELSAKETEVVIKQMDCLEFLRSLDDKSIDVIATDPAYSGMNNKLMLGHGRIVGKYKAKGTTDGKWFAEFEDTSENYAAFLSECKRVLKPEGHLYIMFDSFSLLSLGPVVREYFDVKNLITWDKVNMGMGHYFRRRHEFIMFATNGNNRKISKKSYPDVWRVKRIHNAKYPTQKPVEIFDIMLSASAKKGFTVCDPFAGSGSTAIAAIKHGCHFVGNDISETAVKIMKDRTKTYIKQGLDILQRQSCIPEGEKKFW